MQTHGDTALHQAVYKGQDAAIKALLAAKADVNAKPTVRGRGGGRGRAEGWGRPGDCIVLHRWEV